MWDPACDRDDIQVGGDGTTDASYVENIKGPEDVNVKNKSGDLRKNKQGHLYDLRTGKIFFKTKTSKKEKKKIIKCNTCDSMKMKKWWDRRTYIKLQHKG